MASGTVLYHRYRLDAQIGAGGMGKVYRGVDMRTSHFVAIKHLNAELAQPQYIERFRREGLALSELNHPNIVKLLDMFEEDDAYYLVMEYVSGGDLNDLLQSGLLPIQRIVEMALDLADALTRAHRLNIIHRDLKPANILIAEDGTLRLTDFGVAHMGSKQRVTDTGVGMGTLEYLAPETLNGEGIDERADIWAFGMILFEMLVGKKPFAGNSIAETVTQILTTPTPDMEKLRVDAPIALVDLVYRMLEKNRDARIRSARQVGVELEAILRGDAPTRSTAPTPVQDNRRRHNLPVQATEFVGREQELTELEKLLADSKTRLVTILAPGGMGKTRLALKVADEALPNFPKGVYFVDLAPLDGADFILATIAEAIDFQFYPGGDPKQQLLDYLHDKKILLLMDNFEHVVEGASIVGEILRAAPGVKILVTSRERLNLSGEMIFLLTGMDFPDWETPEDALEYTAVKLFVQSARRVCLDFELKVEDLHHVARICRLVEGMPLGIVLAAAWVEVLTPREIVNEIEKCLDFLETEMRDMPERHRSIRAVFDYSWELMSETEQQVFMKLSVFRGGFTRDAALGVTGATLHTLAGLVIKSLLRRNAESGRFTIHELLRQYAEGRLDLADSVESVRDAHSAHYAEFLQQRELDLKGRRQTGALNEIEADIENIRAAWLWALYRKNEAAINPAVESLTLFCEMRSRFVEGKELLWLGQGKFENDDANGVIWGCLLRHAIEVWLLQEDAPAYDEAIRKKVEKNLASARQRGDKSEIASCLWTHGLLIHYSQNYIPAIPILEESYALYSALNDLYAMAKVADFLGAEYFMTGQYEQANLFNTQSADLRRQIGDQFGLASVLHNIGSGALIKGLYRDAYEAWQHIGIIHAEIGSRTWLARNNLYLAWLAFLRGEFEQARASSAAALEIVSDSFSGGKSFGLLILGMTACIEEDPMLARRLCEQAIAFDMMPYSRIGVAMAEYDLENYERAKRYLRSALELAIAQYSLSGMALALPVAASIEAQTGSKVRAVELIGLAYHHPASATGWLEKWPAFKRMCAWLESELGTAAYQAARERGKMLDLQAVVKELLGQ